MIDVLNLLSVCAFFSELSSSTVGVPGMLDKTLVLMRITNLFHTLVYIVKTSLSSSVEGSIIGHVV